MQNSGTPERIAFYLDEHVPRAVADGLRRHGVDVLRAQEAGMRGASDEQHLEVALAEGRVIFTQDEDFLRFHAAGQQHPGITFVSQQTSIGEIVRG